MTSTFVIPDRLYFYSERVATQKVDEKQKYGKENISDAVDPTEANLISSLLENGNHAPVIDFDYPIEVIPSTTLGHFHLYIHKEVEWNKYKNVLNALANADLIEKGYAKASMHKGFSAVRPPGVQKLNAPEVSDTLGELAKAKRRNFELELELTKLQGQVAMLKAQLGQQGEHTCKWDCGYSTDVLTDLNYHYFAYCPLAEQQTPPPGEEAKRNGTIQDAF